MILDELGQVDAREAAAALYSLANGAGKQRAARDGALREPRNWRVMFISSGELPTEAKLAEDRGRRARAGQLVRLLDIPAERSCGVFDDVGDDGDAAKLANACTRAAGAAYGRVGPEFVARLIAKDITGDEISKAISAFVAEYLPAASDGQIDRAAQRFGLIAAAGELAITLGVMPWQAGEATMAAAWALEQWVARRGGIESAEVSQAIEQVRLFIEQHGESRFQSLDNSDGKPANNRDAASAAVRSSFA